MTAVISFATPYRVSTITCNGSIGKNVGEVYLDKLFQVIPTVTLHGEEIGFIYVIDKDGKEHKGTLHRKERRVSPKQTVEEMYKKRRFDNAISGYYQTRDGYCPSVKIFKNGSIQMTGVKTIEDGKLLNKQVFETMRRVISEHPEVVQYPEAIACGEFHVRLINSDFSIPYHIRRKDLHQLLISDDYNNTSSFQPGTYPGVKLQYFWNPSAGKVDGRCTCKCKCFGKGDGTGEGLCKKITISIFESGKILITGAIEFRQIDDAYRYICEILHKHQPTLQKTTRV